MQNNQENKFLADIYKLLEVKSSVNLIEIINQRMEEYGLSQHQVGKLLSIPKSTFSRLIEDIETGNIGKVNFFIILKIAQFLSISIDDISKLSVSAMSPELISELETVRKANFIHKYFDVKGLKEIGFIQDFYDINSIESRIVSFFNLSNIYEYEEEVGAVLFSRTKRGSNDKMRELWVRCAYFQFQKIDNKNDFDAEKLKALIPKIRAYTRFEEKGLLTVCRALYQIGVTVIAQKHFPKVQARGGSFAINNKPYIVITDLNDHYSTLWFALMHELYHVLYDFEELKTWKYHITGEADVNLFKEESADYFARELLFPQAKLDYIQHMISSPLLVNEYAKNNNVHPSIIYDFYCYDQVQKGNNKYGLYRQYFGKSSKALQLIRTDPFHPSNTNIHDSLEKIKNILEDNAK